MKGSKTGNNRFLKELNKTFLLNLIRINKCISKSDLSKLSGLSPNSVGMTVKTLLNEGYIHETGTGESKGGRRPVLLELKPASFYSIGIDIDTDSINIILMDSTCRVIHEKLCGTPAAASAETAAGIIEKEINDLLQQFSIGFEKLVGVGISVPGLVESGTRKIILAPNLEWSDVDMKKYLPAASRTPVYVENEAMSSAVCEHWIGSCQGIDHFVCIDVRSGIGSGIFTGGKPYRGAGGSAGEIGHIMVDENGPKCGCGNYGCLETMASTRYIVEKARRIVRQGAATSLNEVKEAESLEIGRIITAAKEGDEAALGILNESARYLGIAVSHIINTLNPSKVVIGKEFVKYADLVMEQLQAVVACKALKYPASKVEITASSIGEKASALGAAIIPLKNLFGEQ